jgi:hypothetical protein
LGTTTSAQRKKFCPLRAGWKSLGMRRKKKYDSVLKVRIRFVRSINLSKRTYINNKKYLLGSYKSKVNNKKKYKINR